jgi:hypothetical protein
VQRQLTIGTPAGYNSTPRFPLAEGMGDSLFNNHFQVVGATSTIQSESAAMEFDLARSEKRQFPIIDPQ